MAIFVCQANSDAVDLGFNQIGERLLGKAFQQAPSKINQFVGTVSIIEAKHGLAVLIAIEGIESIIAHGLSGGGIEVKLGLSCFKLRQF